VDDLLPDPLDRPVIDANIRYDIVCRNWLVWNWIGQRNDTKVNKICY
jgi:hypothetical protein